MSNTKQTNSNRDTQEIVLINGRSNGNGNGGFKLLQFLPTIISMLVLTVSVTLYVRSANAAQDTKIAVIENTCTVLKERQDEQKKELMDQISRLESKIESLSVEIQTNTRSTDKLTYLIERLSDLLGVKPKKE
ncbi:MAG: hypothetical protein DRP74_08115 [Candidatus Omnitrophota bacterium]|nr:MAG: hypothetical protein DRP74_08115 [Candidatus Omnitrophota bacterium]